MSEQIAFRDKSRLVRADSMSVRNYERITIDDAWRMLQFIQADLRDQSIKVGGILKDQFDNGGFTLWDEWSQRSDRYREKDTRSVWRSLGKNSKRAGIGTLVYLARQGGWSSDAKAPETAPKPRSAPAPQRERETSIYAARLWLASRFNDNVVGAHSYSIKRGITWAAGAGRGIADGKLIGRGADCVIVPIRTDGVGKLQGVQCINADGIKQTFGAVNGGCLVLGNILNKNLPWYVAEGWASAFSDGLSPSSWSCRVRGRIRQTQLDVGRRNSRACVQPRRSDRAAGTGLMSKINVKILPRTEAGNDPNDHRADLDYLNQAETLDPVAWVRDFIMSAAEIAELKSPEWIVPDLVISGHLVIVVAEPNGGKTTIFSHLASDMVRAGFRVFYVNADISGSDAAEFIETASQGGWVPMLPDLRPGLSMQDVVDRLTTMNETGGNLSDVVFIFDTFKKMTDVIAKKQARELLKLLRSLTTKGMTVILLAHTNKYRDAEGKPIFEGTGDVRSNVDELIYLIPQKHPDGTMTVSTAPDKIRGDFTPITFNITRDRQVTRASEYDDTATQRMRENQYQADAPDIRVILDAIEAGTVKQTEIIEHCKAHRVGKRTTLRLLRDYAGGQHQQWESQRGLERNTVRYSPVSVGN